MASSEEREKHANRRKRNRLAKIVRESKIFSQKVLPSEKEYRREKIHIREVQPDEDDENLDCDPRWPFLQKED
jgi:hypothetical protein